MYSDGVTIYEFDAIGTHWLVESLDDRPIGAEVRQRLTEMHERFDASYSRFRNDSLVAALAKQGYLPEPPSELLAMLDFAHEMYVASDGAFNPSVGAALHAMGYGSREHGGKTVADIWKHISYTPDHIRVPAGTMLDFGGFGKGWLIDVFARELSHYGHERYIINGGGDIYISSDAPIEFALEHPYDPTRTFGQTRITQGALAASSTIKRTWQSGDQRHHHIIDPATNASSTTGIVATYVRADTALIADTMATILLLRPELEHQLAARYGLQVILVPEDFDRQ